MSVPSAAHPNVGVVEAAAIDRGSRAQKNNAANSNACNDAATDKLELAAAESGKATHTVTCSSGNTHRFGNAEFSKQTKNRLHRLHPHVPHKLSSKCSL